MLGYIITGTRRGLGKALATEVLANGDFVLSLSRASDTHYERYINIFCDLSNTQGTLEPFRRLLSQRPSHNLTGLVLINNAGILTPVGPIDKVSPRQIEQNLTVNLVAPAILIAEFLRLTETFQGPRRIINISSGAARHAYAGWAAYCSAKAGLDMLTKSVAIEQGDASDAVKIISFAPGVVDTDMQDQIRQAGQEEFPLRHRFMALKQKGELLDPQLVARTLLSYDRSNDLEQGGLYDIRRMLAG